MRAAWCVAASLLLGVAFAGEEAYLGVTLAPVGPDLASYLELEGGALIVSVQKGSPAEKAGLKPKDIVLRYNKEAVAGPADLSRRVQESKAGSTVPLVVLRKGKELAVKVVLGKRTVPPEEKGPGFLGIAFGPVPPPVGSYLNLGPSPGVTVLHVVPGSPAEKAGLKEKDIIRRLNKEAVRDPQQFRKLMAAHRAGDTVQIHLLRAGREKAVTVTLAERPPQLKMPSLPGPYPCLPHIEQGKGKIILRWRSPDGTEHQETIELPFPEEFEFTFPRFPDFPKGPVWRDTLKQSLREAQKRIEEFCREMQRQHRELKKKLRVGEGCTEVPKGGTTQAVVISKSSSSVFYNDGTYEISIRTEDGEKTVTVKKKGKILARDLPYEKLSTLPEDVQKKVKEIEKGVKIEVKTQYKGKAGKEPPKKKILKLPTQQV